MRLVWLGLDAHRLAGIRVSDAAAQYTRGQGWSDLTHEMKRFALGVTHCLKAVHSLCGWITSGGPSLPLGDLSWRQFASLARPVTGIYHQAEA